MGITPAACRTFVNTIVNIFDVQNNQPEVDMFSADLAQRLANERARIPVNQNEDSFVENMKTYATERCENSTRNGTAQFFALSGSFQPHKSGLNILWANLLGTAEQRQAARLDQTELQVIESGAESFLERFNYPADLGSHIPLFFPRYSKTLQLESYIFRRAYSAASPDLKREIIAQLAPFNAQVNSFSYSTERLIIKIQELIQRVFPREASVRFFISAGAGLSLYYLIGPALLPRIANLFTQTVFPQAQSLLYRYGSITIIHLYEKGFAFGMVAIARIVNSHVYHYMYVSYLPSLVLPNLVGNFVPSLKPVLSTIDVIHDPIHAAATYTAYYLYDLCFNPAVLARREIAQSLEGHQDRAEAQTFLEEGMKAYQAWIYVMTEGPEKGLFQAAPVA